MKYISRSLILLSILYATLKVEAQGRYSSSVSGYDPINAGIGLSISEGVIVEAGPNVAACLNTPGVTLSGIVEGATNSGVWTTTGDGKFNEHAVEINAVYLPGRMDVSNGTVWVRLTSTHNNGHAPVTDSLRIDLMPMPKADAGEDVIMPVDGMLQLNGQVSDGATLLWSTLGDGEIIDAINTTTGYRPALTDAGKSIPIMLQTTNGCGIVMDALIAHVIAVPAPPTGFLSDR